MRNQEKCKIVSTWLDSGFVVRCPAMMAWKMAMASSLFLIFASMSSVSASYVCKMAMNGIECGNKYAHTALAGEEIMAARQPTIAN